MKQQLKIIVPNNNKYTRHLKLTEKQEQELIAYNKAGAEYFKKAFQHRAKKNQSCNRLNAHASAKHLHPLIGCV